VVFYDQALHCGHEVRTVEPVYLTHFLDKGALPKDRGDQVDTEDAGVVPVVAQYFADRDATGFRNEAGFVLFCVDENDVGW
jgi:hypothetical protein